MNRRTGAIIATIAIAISVATFCGAAAKWEPVRTDISSLKPVARSSEISVRVAPGQLVVTSSQQVQIKIFTILGQVVSSETIPAGVNRLTLSHGVYIVKVGDLTCKIAV